MQRVTESFQRVNRGDGWQGSRLTFQLSSQVASERFDFTSQLKINFH